MAILFGTTGDGETLPVLVDQFGNLLAKGIDGETGPAGPAGPDGAVGADGPPGIDGKDGTDGIDGKDGEGVPKPYGAEGSYLGIIGGVPTWNIPVGPGPEPEPPDPDAIFKITSPDNYWDYFNTSGVVVQPPGATPDSFAREQPNWLTTATSLNSIVSAGPSGKANYDNSSFNFEIELTNSFGKILELYVTYNYDYDNGVGWQGYLNISTDDTNITVIQPQMQFPKISGTYPNQYQTFKLQFLFNREASVIIPKLVSDYSFANIKNMIFHGWQIVDAGYYALQQQLALESRIMRALEAREQLRLAENVTGTP